MYGIKAVHFTGKDTMAATEQVILVDENDQPIGVEEKLAAHRKGLCHRAFSIFIIKPGQELTILLQQRASGKYHSPNLWTNTCCSHPRPGEDIIQAGGRRLREEMGIETTLENIGHFHYVAHFDNGLIENEIDHVLIGYSRETVFKPNIHEAQAYRWVTITELKNELATQPDLFTPWLMPALDVVIQHRQK